MDHAGLFQQRRGDTRVELQLSPRPLCAVGDPQVNQSASCPEATHLSRERDTEYIKTLDVEGFSRPSCFQLGNLLSKVALHHHLRALAADLMQSIMLVQSYTYTAC